MISAFINDLHQVIDNLKSLSFDLEYVYCKRLTRLFHVLAPVFTAVIFYRYLKYVLVLNAYHYEEWVKKRSEYLRKLSKQLRTLAKRYKNVYFYYLPMNHGKMLPPTYSVFMAIKEVLLNANKPATRVLSKNLLIDLLIGSHRVEHKHVKFMDIGDLLYLTPDELDPLSEYNLEIMRCSRELVITGIKDFNVMSTVFRVMESVEEEFDY